jgi:hypothetical protein
MQWLQTNVPTAVPPTGMPPTPQSGAQIAPAPFPIPFAPQYTAEQEKQMLEQQLGFLEAQLETIRKRLEELSK